MKRAKVLERPLNYIDGKDCIKRIRKTFDAYNSNIISNLGPYGASSLIISIEDQISRDGYNNMKSLKSTSRVINSIIGQLNKISAHMNFIVGDGTTSGVPIAFKLYKGLTDKLVKTSIFNNKTFYRFSPLEVKNIFKVVREYINEKIEEEKYFIDFNKLENEEKLNLIEKVARTAANGRTEISELFKSLYQEMLNKGINTNIFIEPKYSYTNEELKDECIVRNSVDSQRYFISDDLGITTNHIDNISIIVFNSDETCEFTEIHNSFYNFVKSYMEDKNYKKPLFIFSKGLSSLNETCKKLNLESDTEKKIYMINYDEGHKPLNGLNDLDDLAMLLDIEPIKNKTEADVLCEAIDEENYIRSEKYIGNAGGIEFLTNYYMRLKEVNIKNNKKVKKHITLLEKALFEYEKKDIDEHSKSVIKIQLNDRIRFLNGTTFFYRINTRTKEEYEKKELIIMDVAHACKNIVKFNKITLGGNISIQHILKHNKNDILKNYLNKNGNYNKYHKIVLDIIESSFSESFRRIYLNKYYNGHLSFELLLKNLLKDKKKLEYYDIVSDEIIELKKNSKATILNSMQTEIELVNIIFSVVGDLFETKNIITNVEPDKEYPIGG